MKIQFIREGELLQILRDSKRNVIFNIHSNGRKRNENIYEKKRTNICFNLDENQIKSFQQNPCRIKNVKHDETFYTENERIS
jgi:hypothetical protein